MQYKNLNSDERREAVKLLYSNALSGIGVSALVSFVLVFAFDLTDERTNQEKIIWLFFRRIYSENILLKTLKGFGQSNSLDEAPKCQKMGSDMCKYAPICRNMLQECF